MTKIFPRRVIYHLDDCEMTYATLEGMSGEYGIIKLDFTTPELKKYIDKPNWFNSDYVKSHNHLVLDHASEGTQPGEWSEITSDDTQNLIDKRVFNDSERGE